MQNHLVTACFSEHKINFQNLQATFATEQIKKREGRFVLIKLAAKKYIYVKDYGGIVFFGVDPEEQESILKQIDNQAPIKLTEHKEIKYRYNAIKEQLNIVKDNFDLFKDLNLHQHNSLLEWIIIWLILFEVIHVIIDQLI